MQPFKPNRLYILLLSTYQSCNASLNQLTSTTELAYYLVSHLYMIAWITLQHLLLALNACDLNGNCHLHQKDDLEVQWFKLKPYSLFWAGCPAVLGVFCQHCGAFLVWTGCRSPRPCSHHRCEKWPRCPPLSWMPLVGYWALHSSSLTISHGTVFCRLACAVFCQHYFLQWPLMPHLKHTFSFLTLSCPCGFSFGGQLLGSLWSLHHAVAQLSWSQLISSISSNICSLFLYFANVVWSFVCAKCIADSLSPHRQSF